MLSLSFTGDIAFSKYFKTGYEKENLLSNGIVEFLSTSDYTIANVEAPVTEITASAIKPLVHVSHPRLAETLSKINAKVWNLANNHTMDCGEQGLVDTLNHAKNSGALTVGAGFNIEQASKPLILEKEGVKVGIISITSHFAVGATKTQAGCFFWDEFKLIKKRIKEIKGYCDYCVVVVHGGEEFSQIPLPYARAKYIKYLNFGADIVIGHHPHVPQNYEVRGKKVIFYSLGNFIFDTDYQRTQRNTDVGVLVKINFEKQNFTWASKGIKIDREENVVKDGELPLIFQDISAKDYVKLIPLADADYDRNLERKLKFMKKDEQVKDAQTLFKTKVKRLDRGERAWAYAVRLKKRCKPWKNLDKNLLEYIGQDLIEK